VQHRRIDPVVLALVVAKIGIHLASTLRDNWFRDEFYYLACARRLDWSYVDHPAFSIAALAALGSLATSLITLRLLTAALGGLCILVAADLAKQVQGSTAAMRLTAIALLLSPGFLGLYSFYSMNAWEPLFWLAGAICLIRLSDLPADRRRWLVLSLVLAIGLHNKWSMLWFGVPALAVTAVGVYGQRPTFETRAPRSSRFLAGPAVGVWPTRLPARPSWFLGMPNQGGYAPPVPTRCNCNPGSGCTPHRDAGSTELLHGSSVCGHRSARGSGLLQLASVATQSSRRGEPACTARATRRRGSSTCFASPDARANGNVRYRLRHTSSARRTNRRQRTAAAFGRPSRVGGIGSNSRRRPGIVAACHAGKRHDHDLELRASWGTRVLPESLRTTGSYRESAQQLLVLGAPGGVVHPLRHCGFPDRGAEPVLRPRGAISGGSVSVVSPWRRRRCSGVL
jgi:hypothetical protein